MNWQRLEEGNYPEGFVLLIEENDPDQDIYYATWEVNEWVVYSVDSAMPLGETHRYYVHKNDDGTTMSRVPPGVEVQHSFAIFTPTHWAKPEYPTL